MIITKLESGLQKKVRVYIDNEYVFLLYANDIRRYKLEEGMELTKEQYMRIIDETIFRRAKQKALAILKRMDRTEYELRQKLRQAEYSDEIINRTMNYINQYHYVDDERFVENYILYKKGVKSIKQIRMELIQKGIEREMIDSFMVEEDMDEKAIIRAIRKKTQDVESLSREQKGKLAAYLYRKGFTQDLIGKYIDFR